MAGTLRLQLGKEKESTDGGNTNVVTDLGARGASAVLYLGRLVDRPEQVED